MWTAIRKNILKKLIMHLLSTSEFTFNFTASFSMFTSRLSDLNKILKSIISGETDPKSMLAESALDWIADIAGRPGTNHENKRDGALHRNFTIDKNTVFFLERN